MVTEPQFQLTTRDHAILQAMYDQHRGPHGPYKRLLDQKLRASAIAFSNDIPPGVITLDSRVAYRIDGVPAGPHVLVQGKSAGEDLSIETILGLALLGLSEGTTVTVDLGDGVTQQLHVESVLSQPEAQARARRNANSPASSEPGAVLRFRPRAPAARQPEPEDDDPGPHAA